MMKEQQNIALDFKVARNKAGLRQADCAHLLGVNKTRISHIENGEELPTVVEAATLAIVYGKPVESLFVGLIDEITVDLIGRLPTIPHATDNLPDTFNRTHTLQELAKRLEALASSGYEAA
jgi:DNA-binding XRE family transcriptional regulator